MTEPILSLRKASVFVQDQYCGLLEETEEGYRFTYDDDYLASQLPAVSLTLPTQKEPFSSSVLFPFFDGLIPEGYLLDLAVKNWKLDGTDRFGLLLVSCRDCIGDVTIYPKET